MKVCVVTTAHFPDDIRINKQINTLVKAGYNVTLVAPEGEPMVKGINFVSLGPRPTSRIKRMRYSK
ncbi:MAG: Glycosyltransferase [Thermotogales bacterium 46_20]|nr:MAG: Glycosyltransferase [Thermotogales bacterium 46_20]